MKTISIFSFLIVCLIFLSCGEKVKKGPEFPVEIKKMDNVIYVKNPAFPKNPSRELILIEELTIGSNSEDDYILGRPIKIKIDDKGNIYVLDIQSCQMLKFGKNGNHIKTFASKGQGPGELLLPRDFLIDQKNRLIHILDSKNNKIARYNLDGELMSEIRLKESYPYNLFLVNNEFYFVAYNFKDDKLNQKSKIIKYSMDGNILLISSDFILTEIKVVSKGNAVRSGATPFDPIGHFTCSPKGYLYYGLSSAYEFTVYDQNFNKTRVIKKQETERIKIPGEKIAKYISYLKGKEREKGKPYFIESIKFPEFYPFFKEFWLDDKERIIFRTPPHEDKEQLDVFDTEGIYIERIILNPPGDGISLNNVLWKPEFKDGCIYCIVNNKDELTVVKKYKLLDKN